MRVFVKHLRVWELFGTVFLLSTNGTIAEDLSNFQLISVSSEHYFYNFERRDQDLFIGSDAGVLAYKDLTQMAMIDPAKKGYISLENGTFTSSNYLKGNIYTPHYKMLLPAEFRHNSILGTVYKNNILLISKGQLFIFKRTIKPRADTLSIRTISPHFIGSYSGIFSNGNRFAYPSYTNGYIREYPNETFICYDGLLRLKGKDTIRYETNGGNALIGNTDIGQIKDIFKIDSSRYLLFSDKGLCISDLKSNPRWIKQQKQGPEPRFLKAYYRDNLAIVIYFIDGNKIQKFNLLNNAYTTLLQIDSSFGNIEGAYVSSNSPIYLVTENKLVKATADTDGKIYSFETLVENLVGNHHIIPFTNQLLITSNVGLSSYNLDNREWIPHIIRDEFNHRAIYLDGENYILGTIHGYYQLSKSQIEQLISLRIEELKQESEPVYENHSNQIIYAIATLCSLLLGLSIYLVSRPKKSTIELKAKASEIISYIESNLKDVTIVNICHEFKINPLQLNDILGNDKPGEMIRSKRLEIVRKMRKNGRKEEDIAIATGFSVSYLKKIKT